MSGTLAEIGGLAGQPIHVVIAVSRGMAVEVGLGHQVSADIVRIRLALPQRQLAAYPAAKLVIDKAGGVQIGVGLGQAIAQFVVAIASHLLQGVGYCGQAAQSVSFT